MYAYIYVSMYLCMHVFNKITQVFIMFVVGESIAVTRVSVDCFPGGGRSVEGCFAIKGVHSFTSALVLISS